MQVATEASIEVSERIGALPIWLSLSPGEDGDVEISAKRITPLRVVELFGPELGSELSAFSSPYEPNIFMGDLYAQSGKVSIRVAKSKAEAARALVARVANALRAAYPSAREPLESDPIVDASGAVLASWNREATLLIAQGALSDAVKRDDRVLGEWRGQRVTVMLSSDRAELSILAPKNELTLSLRPQGAVERFLTRRGALVDLTFGDPAFDDHFVVEAAPSDLARALLTEDLRTRLRARHPISIALQDGTLSIDQAGGMSSFARFESILSLAAAIASGLTHLEERADAIRRGEASGSPYRAPPHSAEGERAKDREHLEQSRKRLWRKLLDPKK